MQLTPASPDLIDSRHAFLRLLTALALMTLGSVGMYVVVVVLPVAQIEFGITRADASLPYTVLMVGFGIGGILMGRWSDRYGVFKVLLLGAAGNLIGFVWASLSPNILSLAFAHGMIGMLGGSASFAPLLADTALWWNKRRGIAVGICASGNYLAGTMWPPIMQWGIDHLGWRHAYLAIGIICGVGITLLALRMRQRPPLAHASPAKIGRAHV